MRFLSICSGIEAASVAWKHLGWDAVGFAEIDPFASAVLKHHFPNTPNHGDITQYKSWGIAPGTVDLVCGGPPCQAFSIAGQRGGMADPRGNLTLTYLALVDHLKPRWIVYENVPGLLSSGGGADFASFIEGLARCGYHCTWRVLDPAQSQGRHHLPQRRRRVFLVGYLGETAPAATVLLKPESLCGNPAEGHQAGQDPAPGSDASLGKQSQGVSTVGTLCARDYKGADNIYAEEGKCVIEPMAFRKSRRAQTKDDCETWVEDGKANTLNVFDSGDTRTTHAVVEPSPVIIDRAAFNQGENAQYEPRIEAGEIMSTVIAKGPHAVGQPITFQPSNLRRHAGSDPSTEATTTLKASMGDQMPHICNAEGVTYAVRRLTVTECRRLQGFPDGWTQIPWRGKPADQCPDGPQYKAIGNSWAVPMARWIGERIAAWEAGTLR